MQNKHGWTNLEKIETDYSRGFRKLANSFPKFIFVVYNVCYNAETICH